MRSIRLSILALAAILSIAACSGTSTSAPTNAPSAAPEANAEAIAIAGRRFSPATIDVAVGTTVTWTNNDAVPHTVTADDAAFASDTLSSGTQFSHTFDVAGTFTYHCSIHSTMIGTVTVH